MREATGFTRYALDVYAEPGVSAACLLLQDRRGVDVTLVLFAACVGVRRGRTLTQSELDDVIAAVQDWHVEVVLPLRRVRRRLRSGPDPAPNGDTEELRERVGEVELYAEMIELDRLGVIAEALAVDAGPASTQPPGLRHASAGIELVVHCAGDGTEVDPDERDAVETIARAAASFGVGA